MNNIHNSKDATDFSLVLGGPLFQLLMRLGLTTPTLNLLKKRIIVITLLAWLPLLLLSLINGKAWGSVGMTFLYDIETQVRFLVALPLLIAAEILVHMRMRLIVQQFVERNIITVIQLIIFTLIPVLPLVLTMIPLEVLLKKLFEAIF